MPWATYNSQLQPRIDTATATRNCAALRAFLTAAKTTSTVHEKATGFPNDALVSYIQASQHEAGYLTGMRETKANASSEEGGRPGLGRKLTYRSGPDPGARTSVAALRPFAARPAPRSSAWRASKNTPPTAIPIPAPARTSRG